MEKDTNKTLDSLVESDGIVVKQGDYVVIDSKKVGENIDRAVRIGGKKSPYDDNADIPMPGETIAPYLDEMKTVTKESAMDNLVTQSALLKAQSEKEQEDAKPKKLTKEEREAQKQYIVDYVMKQTEEAFYVEHHHIMDGRTRRRTRAMISKNYDKGMYRPRKGAVDLNA